MGVLTPAGRWRYGRGSAAATRRRSPSTEGARGGMSVMIAAREQAWCVVVPHHARGAGLARRRLANDLSGLVPSELLADSVTVVAELVGNAVRHAAPLPGDVVRVAWRLRTGVADVAVEVRVTDGGSDGPPTPRHAGPEAVD